MRKGGERATSEKIRSNKWKLIEQQVENGIATGGTGRMQQVGPTPQPASQPATQPARCVSLWRYINKNFTIIERIIIVKREEDWKY